MEFVQPIRDKNKIEAMKKVLKGKSYRDYCFFLLGINSGLRISDLLNLKVSDVLDKKGKVKDRVTIREKKTGKLKNFPFGCNVKKALADYIKQNKLYTTPDMPLFPSRKGNKPITRQHAHRILNEAARAVGIDDNIGTHTLRKTFGYHAYQKGMDIILIQETLNHSAPSVTKRYLGVTQDDVDQVYMTVDL